jgi:CheY-like chemotaxis protein
MPPSLLIVEDDEPTRSLLVTVSRRAGYEIAEAGDGAAALDRIATKLPDIVLLDLFLPELSGFDVLRRIQADYPTLASRVVVITAVAASILEDHHNDLKSVHACMRKPLDMNELLDTLAACAKKTGASDGEERKAG